MELGEFKNDYLANILEKFSLENKTLVLLGDFNTNLLKYDIDKDISNFLDLMYSSFLLHPFTLPVQLAPQQHRQPLLITYSPITATLLTPLVILLSYCLTIMLNS